jgi:hypothetical protein
MRLGKNSGTSRIAMEYSLGIFTVSRGTGSFKIPRY